MMVVVVEGLHAALLCGLYLGPHLTYAAVAAWLAGHLAVSLLVGLLSRPDEDAVWGDSAALSRRLAVAAALAMAGFAAAASEGKVRGFLTASVSRLAYDAVVWDMVAGAMQDFVALAALSGPTRWGASISSHLAFGLAAVTVLGPAPDGPEPRALAELARQALDGRTRGRLARALLSGPLAAGGQAALLRGRAELGWLVDGLLTAAFCACAAVASPQVAALAAMAAPWAARLAAPERRADWALLAVAALVLLSPGTLFVGHVWTRPLVGTALVSFAVAAWRLR